MVIFEWSSIPGQIFEGNLQIEHPCQPGTYRVTTDPLDAGTVTARQRIRDADSRKSKWSTGTAVLGGECTVSRTEGKAHLLAVEIVSAKPLRSITIERV